MINVMQQIKRTIGIRIKSGKQKQGKRFLNPLHIFFLWFNGINLVLNRVLKREWIVCRSVNVVILTGLLLVCYPGGHACLPTYFHLLV